MEGAKRLVFDTSIYIGAIRGGLFSPTFRMLQETLPRTYLSSVVSAELLAGATDPAARRAVMDFVRRAHRVRRVVTPDTRTWERAGERLGEIHQDNPHLRPRIKTFWHDVLIAMSAKQVGAMVVTQNAQDFQLLQRHIPFELHILALDIHRSFA